MFGNLGEIANLMKKAKDIQKNLKEMQGDLASIECTGESENGMVEVVVSGDLTVKRIFIKEAAMFDREVLEDTVQAAVNNALAGVKAKSQDKLSKLTGGINIPGLFN
ncbi:MAG: nucleoid-associated protein, YbaB/EbfC family [Lentisphaerae bacterium GWF2_45_14]|nr:MAG: nucleoid-associated protein, YbaB/EbfC family [Lentisphaerae bacterium GWF2_45_14]